MIRTSERIASFRSTVKEVIVSRGGWSRCSTISGTGRGGEADPDSVGTDGWIVFVFGIIATPKPAARKYLGKVVGEDILRCRPISP